VKFTVNHYHRHHPLLVNVFGGLQRARCAKKLLTSDKNNIIYCRTRNGDAEYEKQWPDQPPFQGVGGKFEIERHELTRRQLREGSMHYSDGTRQINSRQLQHSTVSKRLRMDDAEVGWSYR
jgi:hypothetical protein